MSTSASATGTSGSGFGAGGIAPAGAGREKAGEAATGDGDLDPELAALLAAAGELLKAALFRQKRRRLAAAEAAARPAYGNYVECLYPSMNTRVRAFFERFRDHERLKPLVRQRHRARPGQFDSERLRLLEDFVLSLNLSQAHQTKLYNLLVFWELTMPGAPGDDGTSVPLRQSFKSPHAFRQAIADCIDRAVIDDGWMSSIITEGGVEVEAFIRNALHQGTRYLRAAKKVRFWIGGDGVAEPTDRREGPLDGDAFRMCEAEVVAGHGRSAFVLAVYIYSDSSVVSWSGGTFESSIAGVQRGERVCIWHRGMTDVPADQGEKVDGHPHAIANGSPRQRSITTLFVFMLHACSSQVVPSEDEASQRRNR